MKVYEIFSTPENKRAHLVASYLKREGFNFEIKRFCRDGYRGKNILVYDFYRHIFPTVIMSAHYDGIGAYDNAGGAVVLFHLLKWLKNMRTGAKRSILCVFLDGEERGLLGAQDFCDVYLKGIQDTVGHLSLDGFGVGTEVGCFGNLCKIELRVNGEIKKLFLRADTAIFQKHGIYSLHCFSLPSDQLTNLVKNNKFPFLWHILHTERDSPLIIEDELLYFIALKLIKKLDALDFKRKGVFKL